jgi:competence protein ComEC
MRTLAIVFLAALLVSPVQAANKLDIYTIDVEGGKSVLIVSPSGQTMLIDAGWARGARPSGLGRVIIYLTD